MNHSFFQKAFSAFLFTLISVLLVNYIGSLWLFDELRLSLGFALLAALIAGLSSYLRQMRNYVENLEQRILMLEHSSSPY